MVSIRGLYLFVTIILICVSFQNCDSRRRVKSGEVAEIGIDNSDGPVKDISNKAKVDLTSTLDDVTCTDCQKKDNRKQKIRHSRRKLRENNRNFHEELRIPSKNDEYNISEKTPLGILFRTFVNGKHVAQWKVSLADVNKNSSNKKTNSKNTNTNSRNNNKNSRHNNKNSRNKKTNSNQDDFISQNTEQHSNPKRSKDESKVQGILIEHGDNQEKAKSSVAKHGYMQQEHKHLKITSETRHNSQSVYKDFMFHKLKESAVNKRPQGDPAELRNLKPYKPYRRLDNMNQKLYNKLQGPMRSLLRSMELILDNIDWRADQVISMNDFAINSTRFVMMNGARDILQNVIKCNNLVYGTVLDASRLTRSIYKRSHERQQQVLQPEPIEQSTGIVLDLGKSYHNLSIKNRKYQNLLNDVKMMKMKSQQVADRVRQIRENLEDNLGRVELKDLIFVANQTRIKLESEFKQSNAIRKHERYRNFVTDVQFIITDSKMKMRKASEHVRTATINTRGNLIASQDRKRKRTVSGVDGGLLAPVSIMVPAYSPFLATDSSPPTSSSYSKEERTMLQGVIRQAKQHSTFLAETARKTKRLLEPLLREAKHHDVLSKGRQPTSTRSISSHIIHTIQELYRVLSTISYSINFKTEFIKPCIFNDNIDDACLGEIEGSGRGGEMDGCTEGSTCDGLEGSGIDIYDGSDPSADMDFEFEPDSITDKQDKGSVIFQEFGDHLTKHSNSAKQTSKEVLEQAEAARHSVREQAEKWNRTKKQVELSANFIKESNNFNTLWAKEELQLTSSHLRIRESIDSVDFKFNLTQSQTFQAVIKAENKVRDMQSNGKDRGDIEGSAEGDDEDDSDVDIPSVIAKVSVVNTDIKSFKQLRSKTPMLCEDVQDRIRKIRSDIKDLKSIVSRARLVLSTLQMSVNIDNTSYITSKVEGRSDDLSLSTDIGVCIKPAVKTGVVLIVDDNYSVSYTLEMENGKLLGIFKDKRNSEVVKLTHDEPLIINTWYRVRFRRVGTNFTMWINTTDGENQRSMSSTISTEYHQPEPDSVYIGGDPDATGGYFSGPSYPWAGCVSGLIVNGKLVPLFSKTNIGTTPTACNKCSFNLEPKETLRFEGTGYSEFPVTLLNNRPTVSIEFRTKQATTFIMSIYHRSERFYLEVFLTNGAVIIKTTTLTESILLQTQKLFNDNKFHALKIEYRDSRTYPILDGEDGLFAIEKQTSIKMRRDGILLGGSYRKHEIFDQSALPNLIGCLRNLRLNSHLVSNSEMVDFNNIYTGSCFTHTLWGNCVGFDETSKGIKYTDMESADIVGLTILPDSSGPLLHYYSKQRFNLLLSVQQGVLYIKETIKNFQTEINFPPNTTFIPITIKDVKDDKTLKITILNEERGIQYGKQSGWIYAATNTGTNSKYTLILGASNDDLTKQFIGGIAEFFIKLELQNLANFFSSNGLTSCNRYITESAKQNDMMLNSCR